MKACPQCDAATARDAAVCWLCGGALPAYDERPPRAAEGDFGIWSASALAAAATALAAGIELAQSDPIRALCALAVVGPVIGALGWMAAQRRLHAFTSLPAPAWRGALALVSLGLALLFVVIVVSVYSARFVR